MKNLIYTLYYISSSRDDTAFYVGITSQPLHRRLGAHKRYYNKYYNFGKFKRITTEIKRGYEVNITPIFTGCSLEEVEILEVIAIPFFRNLGFSLENISPGGSLVSDITRQRIKEANTGKKMPDITRIALAKANEGFKHSPETIEKMSLLAKERHSQPGFTRKGWKHTEESKKQMSENMKGKAKGRVRSPESIAKYKETRKRNGKKLSLAACLNISEAKKKLGISPENQAKMKAGRKPPKPKVERKPRSPEGRANIQAARRKRAEKERLAKGYTLPVDASPLEKQREYIDTKRINKFLKLA